MKVAVWDTYVERSDNNGLMHFDILVSEELKDIGQIKQYGLDYLKSKEMATDRLTIDKCIFCHIEEVPPHLAKEIENYGYTIVELSNCD